MKINTLRYLLFLFLLPEMVFSQPASTALNAEFEAICSQKFPADGPGGSVLVAKGDRILYHKAFGMHDLAQQEPLTPGMVFRIGSVTKQFTAVAILQLVQQGKISLQDEITRFIPDYPTHGKKITVEHLLNHTSGIKSYTSMPLWTPAVQKLDFTPQGLIEFFKDQPMDFDPGTQYAYNNSGYILLGYIIEKVSGMSYAQYLEKKVFKPAGLKRTFYENKSRPIPNWANGYQRDDSGQYTPAAPLSMTQPYAAGSLASTVEDLYHWTRAVHAGKVVSKDLLKKAHTPTVLPDGTDTRYGYGWIMGNVLGSPTIEHDGGIHGFLSSLIYLPEEDVCVAILTNCDCNSPNETAAQLAALAVGHPVTVEPMPMPQEALGAYIGTYENAEGATRIIRMEGERLVSQRIGGGTFNLTPFAVDQFRFDGSLTEATFVRDNSGRVTGLTLNSRSAMHEPWTRTSETVPEAPVAIQLTEAQLERLVGEYALAPGFSIAITREGTKLYGQATGQSPFELFAKSERRFFLKVVDAEIEFFPDEDGKIEQLILFQAGREMPGKRMK